MSRRQAVVFLLLCGLGGAFAAGASPSTYEQTFERLSQAITASQNLAKHMAPYDAVFRRDPLQALIDERGELVRSSGLHGGFSIQGIIWSDTSPLAVIDDELHVQGDTVGPYTIQQVLPEGIIARRGTVALFIPLDRGIELPQEHIVERPSPPASQPAVPAPASATGDGATLVR